MRIHLQSSFWRILQTKSTKTQSQEIGGREQWQRQGSIRCQTEGEAAWCYVYHLSRVKSCELCQRFAVLCVQAGSDELQSRLLAFKTQGSTLMGFTLTLMVKHKMGVEIIILKAIFIKIKSHHLQYKNFQLVFWKISRASFQACVTSSWKIILSRAL